MNIQLQGSNLFWGGDVFRDNGLKSTQEKQHRQAERDSQLVFFEKQKGNLKNMECDSLDEISRKLEMFHSYEDRIVAAKEEYNSSQMMHVLDEARERGEQIAKAAEEYVPKTPEERKEEALEEAFGMDGSNGMLTEFMEELSEQMPEMVTEEKESDIMSMEITNNYSSYVSNYASIGTKGSSTAETDSTTGTSSTSQTTEEYLSYLRQKYSDVNITVADFSSDRQLKSYMFSCSGYNNIAISSSIIEKMASDPAAAAKYEKVIADVPNAAQEMKEGVEALGHELLACGTVIDRSGKVSYWGIGKGKTVENPGTAYKEKVQKQLEEKRAEKEEKEKADAKRDEKEAVEEKQKELRVASAKSKEELLEKIRTNKTEEISVDEVGKIISEGSLKGARLDYFI